MAQHSKDYIHCNGTQLRLTDSDNGSERFNSINYYEWPASGTSSQLLFIFPTRVNLTTITLHYYSDSVRGLPKLRFYAVPDQFNVWISPSAANSVASADVAAVPPSRNQTGRRSVNINVTFSTKKVLMYKHKSDFPLAVSEVEFFNHYSKVAINGTIKQFTIHG